MARYSWRHGSSQCNHNRENGTSATGALPLLPFLFPFAAADCGKITNIARGGSDMAREFSLSIMVAVALSASPTSAQKYTNIWGAGGLSCATYVQAYDAYRPYIGNEDGLAAQAALRNYAQYEAWLQGYMFGVDSWNKKQIKPYDRAELQVWVYDYCRKHTMDIIANAGLAFYRAVGGPTPTGGDVRHQSVVTPPKL